MYFIDVNALLTGKRLRAARHDLDAPAKPKNLLTVSMATIMAISREITCMRMQLLLFTRFRWTTPTLGRMWVVGAEFALVMILCFYKLNPNDQWQWEDLGFRTGPIALAQLPLIFILAGKKNIIGYLIGSSYERLSWLHRWTARSLFLTTTIHMSYWLRGWARYEYIAYKIRTDEITQRGLAAWCILLWIVLSSFAPIRRWNYELFILQHLVTVAGFAAAVYLHIPDRFRVWVWVPIGFAIADRVVRFLSVVYINLSVFHPKNNQSRFWACQATFEPVGSDMTRIIIRNPPIGWSPGQHVFLSCHSVAPLQSHPFTIASIPQDDRMEFLVQSKSGGTRRFFNHAQKHCGLPLAKDDASKTHVAAVAMEGPYGYLRPLPQFDSVVFIAGGCGSTFTVPLLRDLVLSCKPLKEKRTSPKVFETPTGAATRSIRFVWVVKSRQQFEWFAAQLILVAQEVEQLKSERHDINIEISIYITCDEILNSQAIIPSHPTPTGQGEPDEIAKFAQSSDANEKAKSSNLSIHSVAMEMDRGQTKMSNCGTNNACCCTNAIDDESETFATNEECLCSKDNGVVRSNTEIDIQSLRSNVASSLSVTPEKTKGRTVHPAITILTGRPCPNIIIRKTLEQALGESAVVVCGPPGLVDDVRQSVVVLSDERAIHKGTGAQGIYLRTEAFDY